MESREKACPAELNWATSEQPRQGKKWVEFSDNHWGLA